METLIDTNIIYHLVDICNDENIKLEVLKHEIDGYKPLCISELTLIELLTNDFLSNEDLGKFYDYIQKNKIQVLKYPLEEDYKIDYCIKNNDRDLIELKKLALQKKIYIESEILPIVIISVTYIIIEYYNKKIDRQEVRILFEKNCDNAVKGNIASIKVFSRDLVNNYYSSDNQNLKKSTFKESIKDIISKMGFLIYINYNASNKKLLLEAENLKYIDEPYSDAIANKMLSIIKGANKNDILINQNHYKDFDSVLKYFSDFSEKKIKINKGFISYYLLYFEKLFKTGKKFEKNNLIDSLFHMYIPNYKFLTLDRILTCSIKPINIDLYNEIKLFQYKVQTIKNGKEC